MTKRPSADLRLLTKSRCESLAKFSSGLEFLSDSLTTGANRKLSVGQSGWLLHMEDPSRTYHWDPRDPKTATAALVATGSYEPDELEILSRVGQHCEVIFDVGANVGFYAVELGLRCAAAAKIFSYEPLLDAFQALTLNVSLNDLEEKVRCVNLGLSDSKSEQELFVPESSGSSASSLRNLHPQEKVTRVIVELSTIDDQVRERNLMSLDLLKVDVEGAERQVLAGGRRSIASFRPVIFLELLRKWSGVFGYQPQTVLNELEQLDYECFAVSDKLVPISKIDEFTEPTNFLFLARGDHHTRIRDELGELIQC